MQDLEENRSPNGITIYIDQAKFYDKPDLRLMWVLKGQVAEVPTSRSGRNKIIVYGAYNPQIKWLHTQEVIEETGEVTASFFISLRARFPHRRLDVVLDNARWHYGDDVRYVARVYNIHVHYLPTYSPDLNPVEALWLWTRQEKTYNYDYPSVTAKTTALEEFWETVSRDPETMQKRLVPEFTI